MKQIRQWLNNHSRLEIHVPFESIPNERRNQVTLGVKTALAIVSNIAASEQTYDALVVMQSHFVQEIVSLPTINKYFLPLVF